MVMDIKHMDSRGHEQGLACVLVTREVPRQDDSAIE